MKHSEIEHVITKRRSASYSRFIRSSSSLEQLRHPYISILRNNPLKITIPLLFTVIMTFAYQFTGFIGSLIFLYTFYKIVLKISLDDMLYTAFIPSLERHFLNGLYMDDEGRIYRIYELIEGRHTDEDTLIFHLPPGKLLEGNRKEMDKYSSICPFPEKKRGEIDSIIDERIERVTTVKNERECAEIQYLMEVNTLRESPRLKTLQDDYQYYAKLSKKYEDKSVETVKQLEDNHKEKVEV